METLRFKISSSLKNIIGKDLISDDYIAIFELVKNSIDAHSTEVLLKFENIKSGNGRIIIIDNGKGMNREDLTNKWLFLGYSAKKEGVEDDNFDFKSQFSPFKYFAGAKGIGRFSCDKLGKRLLLESTKLEVNPKTEVLVTNWDNFEIDGKNEFKDISIQHETLDKSRYGLKHGTVLEISELRESWDRKKLLKLKDSLSKLVNPKEVAESNRFRILIQVPEELSEDNNFENYYHKVNGEVNNFIFETLGLKTTKIKSSIADDKKHIITELYDGGTLIYKIVERNIFNRLDNIVCTLYFLNRSAKYTFHKKMGVASVNYGHVFLYKNGFRVYPYGEKGEDPLKVDTRKAQGYNRFIGNRELIGYIEIYSDNEEINETSSRGDGLKKTRTFDEIDAFFWHTLKRLEKYVVDVQRWGLSIEEDHLEDQNLNSRIIDLLAKLTSSDEIIDFFVPDNFLSLLEVSQKNSAEAIVNKLNLIALERGDENLISQVKNAKAKLNELDKARKEAEIQAIIEQKKASEATKKLKEQISENLFLKSIKDRKSVV